MSDTLSDEMLAGDPEAHAATPGGEPTDEAARPEDPDFAEGPAVDPLAELRQQAYPDLVPVSALRKVGLAELLGAIDVALEGQLEPVTLQIPYSDGQILNLIHTHGVVDDEAHDEAGTRLRARVPRYLMGEIETYRVETVERK